MSADETNCVWNFVDDPTSDTFADSVIKAGCGYIGRYKEHFGDFRYEQPPRDPPTICCNCGKPIVRGRIFSLVGLLRSHP